MAVSKSALAKYGLHMTASVEERVDKVKDLINGMCNNFLAGGDVGGVEDFADRVLRVLREMGLMEDNCLIQVENVGVHPDNREGSGLIPADVHDLLTIIFSKGYVKTLAKLVACEIPPSQRDRWLAFNEKVAKQSQGLLPPANSSLMKVVTAQGSHTTASFRCVKLGAKCAHAGLTDPDGMISKGKILQSRPSFEEPMNAGLYYSVIKAEVVEACPRLMYVLSRTGNASHGSERPHTSIQQCLAIWRAYLACNSWPEAVESAKAGQNHNFETSWSHLREFVEHHSGGDQAQYLNDLDRFETSLSKKRIIQGTSLGKLSSIRLVTRSGARYVPAMVKAMLVAPESKVVAGNIVEMFSQNDVAGLAPTGKLRKLALEASDYMVQASNFIKAFARTPSSIDLQREVDELEASLISHVHGVQTQRPKAKMMAELCLRFYQKVKAIDDSLPKWAILDGLDVFHDIGSGVENSKRGVKRIRELTEDGQVASQELEAEGFKLGVTIQHKQEGNVYTITNVDGSEFVGITRVIDATENDEAEGKGGKGKGKGGKGKGGKGKSPAPMQFMVDRFSILSDYGVYSKPEMVEFDRGSGYMAESFPLIQQVCWKGLIVDILIREFHKANEDAIRITRPKAITGHWKVFCKKDASKLALGFLSSNIILLESGNATIPSTFFTIGTLPNGYVACFKLFEPKYVVGDNELSLVCGAACIRRTDNVADANMKLDSSEVSVHNVELMIPKMVNVGKIKEGDELITYKFVDEPKPKAKGNKGKGGKR